MGKKVLAFPAADLHPAAVEWVRSVEADYDLLPHHANLLQAAATQWSRALQARDLIDEHGLTFRDRWGQPKERPEVAVERQALNSFRLHLRELGLDLPAPSDSRPPRVGSR